MAHKLLECGFCHQHTSVHDANFPEDLFDLIHKYQIKQVLWLCTACEILKSKSIVYLLKFAEEQEKLKKDFHELKTKLEAEDSSNKKCVPDFMPNSSRACIANPIQQTTILQCSIVTTGMPNGTSISTNLPGSIVATPLRTIAASQNSAVATPPRSIAIVAKSPLLTVSNGTPPRPNTTPSFLAASSTISPCLTATTPNQRRASLTSPLPQRNVNTSPTVTLQNSSNSPISRWQEVANNKIKINEAEEKQNKEIIEKFMRGFVNRLKESDTTFRQLYSRNFPTGSSYEGLRITDANEFDIDLVMKFPFKETQREIVYADDIPSFAKYKLKANWLDSNPLQKDFYTELKKKFVDDEDYFMPNRVRQWMQSILSKIDVSDNLNIKEVKSIYYSESGPAKTVKIMTIQKYEISLDLVPVIEFRHPEWPSGANFSICNEFEVNTTDRLWFLVPKQYIGPNETRNNTSDESNRFWRIQFPVIEKKMIHDRGCVKPVIKLLKLLRDKENWQALCSYYLKTIVMWVVIDHPSSDYWKEDQMHDRLIEVSNKLLNFLKERNIPHVLYPNYNLIKNISAQHADNMYYRLKRLLHQNLETFMRWGMESS